MKYTTEYLNSLEATNEGFFICQIDYDYSTGKAVEVKSYFKRVVGAIEYLPGYFLCEDDGEFFIINSHSGYKASEGYSASEAVDRFLRLKLKKSESEFEIAISEAIEKRGLSPRYKEPIN